MSTAVRNEIHQFCLDNFNGVFIYVNEIVRLIGYGETAIDCYYIVQNARGKVTWGSAVGGLTGLESLKNQGVITSPQGETWTDYSRLDSGLQYAGAPRQAEFRFEYHPEDEELELKSALKNLGKDTTTTS